MGVDQNVSTLRTAEIRATRGRQGFKRGKLPPVDRENAGAACGFAKRSARTSGHAAMIDITNTASLPRGTGSTRSECKPPKLPDAMVHVGIERQRSRHLPLRAVPQQDQCCWRQDTLLGSVVEGCRQHNVDEVVALPLSRAAHGLVQFGIGAPFFAATSGQNKVLLQCVSDAPHQRGSPSVNDPQGVVEYAQQIHELLLHEQHAQQPTGDCLDRQTELNAQMRGILVDWLVDVAVNYKLGSRTLFLTVRLLDQYLELRPVPRKQLQLVGVTAMFVASKFEELFPPSVQDLVYITADAFTQDELISMEIQFLSALEFRVSTPTAAHFFDRVAQSCDERQRNLALYLLELSLTDYRMSRHLPSHVAAASLVLANRLLQVSPEGAAASISEDVGESVFTLDECVQDLCSAWMVSQESPLQAVRKKFRHSRYNAIADAQFADVCMAARSVSSEP